MLRGDVNEHHRYLLRELMDDLERIEAKISRIEAEIVKRTAPYQKQLERLNTIPGVDWVTAWTLLAELGDDMSVFPDAAHAASWAGLVPGNFESAGKRKSNRTRHGNRCAATGALPVRLGRFAQEELLPDGALLAPRFPLWSEESDRGNGT